MTPRVVFDCMILLQAAARPQGPSGGCFEEIELGHAELCLSSVTFAEFQEVIHRPSVRRNFKTLTDERIADFLGTLRRVGVFVDPVPASVSLSRDPKDEKYLNLAVAANAKLIVSRDNDLLDLMTAEDADARAFRTAYPDIAILDPVAFLAQIRHTTSTRPDDSDEAF